RPDRWTRVSATLLLALGTSGTIGVVLAGALVAAAPAAADPGDLAALKAYWQGRYRELRIDEARLVETERLATKEYADANRRNYRRSGVRHFHRTNANEAKAQLEIVRAEIAKLHDDVVAAGGMVSWFDEVDAEGIDPTRVEGLGVYANDGPFGGKGGYAPRRPDGEPLDEEPAAVRAGDDGRNPLYADDEDDGDDPASLSVEDLPAFDYEAWRRNRAAYEAERAPALPLQPVDD